MKLEKFQEHALFITVRIISVNNQNKNASVGTGFLIRVFIDENRTESVTLLISNKHVYNDPKNHISFAFHVKQDGTNIPSLGKTIIMSADNFESNYFPHPDSNIDLACMNVSEMTNEKYKVFYKCIDESFILECSNLDIMPGDSAWFIGYPQNRFDETHNLPILRRGYIASPPNIDFNGKKEFVIDANVYPGSSGSPLFTEFEGKFRLIGVVSQVMIKDLKLQRINSAIDDIGVKQEIGLGIVTKSECIISLIKYATGEINRIIREKKT